MQKKFLKCWIVMLIMSFCSLPLCAQEPDAAQALISILEKIQTFQAHFNQQIRDPEAHQMSQAKGKLVINRPGKFYWKSQEPDPVLVVADGKFLWTYDIDLAQVTKQNLNQAIKNTPATLLSGSLSHLTRDFTITFADKKQCDKNTDQCFKLKPKKKESVSDIVIGFDKGKLKEMRMRSPLGQKVLTRFSAVKINEPVNKKLFTFVVPKGVDVIQSGG